MTWDEFLETARALGAAAAQKVNEATDTAATKIRIAAAEAKLKTAYTEFGKAAYQHFTADNQNDPQILADQVQKIATLEADLQKLRGEER